MVLANRSPITIIIDLAMLTPIMPTAGQSNLDRSLPPKKRPPTAVQQCMSEGMIQPRVATSLRPSETMAVPTTADSGLPTVFVAAMEISIGPRRSPRSGAGCGGHLHPPMAGNPGLPPPCAAELHLKSCLPSISNRNFQTLFAQVAKECDPSSAAK